MKRALLIAVTALVFTGCKTKAIHGYKTYTDTPEGRTARYVHENCKLVSQRQSKERWDSAKGEVVQERAYNYYSCPNFDSWIAIADDEEQP